MDAICTYFENEMNNPREEKNYSTYNGKGTLIFNEQDLRTRLQDYLDRNNPLIRITKCKVSYMNVKKVYSQDIFAIKGWYPIWHPLRWIGLISCTFWYWSTYWYPPYFISLNFERSNGFLRSLDEEPKYATYE